VVNSLTAYAQEAKNVDALTMVSYFNLRLWQQLSWLDVWRLQRAQGLLFARLRRSWHIS
jgi:hypothetical protein